MKAFADTNILIYAVSDQDARKQAIAQRLLAGPQPAPPAISNQVLGEAYNVLTRRLDWPAGRALEAVRLFASLRVEVASTQTVLAGLALAEAHGLSGWDALIVQTALQAGCDTLYSEDLQAGRRFGALQVVNPFAAGVGEEAAHYHPARAERPRRKAGPKPAPRRSKVG